MLKDKCSVIDAWEERQKDPPVGGMFQGADRFELDDAHDSVHQEFQSCFSPE